MLQNLQFFAKFQKFQLDNLVDFEKCCKTHIFLQKSEPIQPKTSNILPKFCQPTLSDVSASEGAAFCAFCGGGLLLLLGAATRVGVTAPMLGVRVGKIGEISKILQIFGGLVLGCIKTNFCKKICV